MTSGYFSGMSYTSGGGAGYVPSEILNANLYAYWPFSNVSTMGNSAASGSPVSPGQSLTFAAPPARRVDFGVLTASVAVTSEAFEAFRLAWEAFFPPSHAAPACDIPVQRGLSLREWLASG